MARHEKQMQRLAALHSPRIRMPGLPDMRHEKVRGQGTDLRRTRRRSKNTGDPARLLETSCVPKRDGRDKPGHDNRQLCDAEE